MKRLLRSNTYWLSLVLLAWLVQPAQGQAPRELKTKPGVAVAMVNLVNPRPDCSGDPGPVALSSLRQKPANGNILMQIIISDVAANGTCPARKIPTIAIATRRERILPASKRSSSRSIRITARRC